ncbi:helix-turn-helix domain-containing protein, partial [Streptomyces sp. SID3343]
MVAAQRDLWRPTEVLAAFRQVGFNPSLSKVAAMWSGTPVTVRLDDLDKMCAALDCTVADLLQAEPLAAGQAAPEAARRAVGAEEGPGPG